jgi:hypothetical protein
MDDSEVILLAHMIGDGSCVKRQPIRYASIDEANLMAVTVAAAHFGVTAIRDDYAAARVTTLRLPAPFRLTHGKRNPIAEWLDVLGLFGLRSCESDCTGCRSFWRIRYYTTWRRTTSIGTRWSASRIWVSGTRASSTEPNAIL